MAIHLLCLQSGVLLVRSCVECVRLRMARDSSFCISVRKISHSLYSSTTGFRDHQKETREATLSDHVQRACCFGFLFPRLLPIMVRLHRIGDPTCLFKQCARLLSSAAFGGAACVHLAVAFFDQSSRWTAVGCIMIGQGLQTALGLLNSMPQDLAPRFAGTLHGTATSVALLVALTAPLIVSALTPNGMYKEWRVVWLLLSAVYLSGSIVFLIFGEIKLQAWADIPSDGGTVKETIDTSQDKNINQHLLND
ncbi:hypothetical protein RRG08_052772 [Elysia crispata]|uniref:Uncharacterized protein n=1 Tax=Elysia crispata TaxID=231223 RepID=A0AAE1B6M1_9GAST|nr:hypothetical protein RRG08_052772 [Elysia crispata]